MEEGWSFFHGAGGAEGNGDNRNGKGSARRWWGSNGDEYGDGYRGADGDS
jgi:hypothetical protein